jgi:Derlin-2/3
VYPFENIKKNCIVLQSKAMDDFKAYIRQVPPVTRYYMGTVLLLTFCVTYKIVSPYDVLLDWSKVWNNYQVWRIITSFFFAGGFSMPFIFVMMMIYWGMNSVEKHFEGRQADLATLLAFNAVVILFYAWLADMSLVMQDKYVFSLIYVWSKLVPDQPTAIWGFPFKSVNLPWVLMGFHLLTGHDPFADLIGVAAGHTYIYLKMVLPDSHGYDLIKTPNMMHRLVAKLN